MYCVVGAAAVLDVLQHHLAGVQRLLSEPDLTQIQQIEYEQLINPNRNTCTGDINQFYSQGFSPVRT